MYSSDNFAEISSDGKSPRSFIRIEKGNGTTEISNSEIGYLGFNGSKSSGLSFYSDSGSKMVNNRIHDLWNGFYSASTGNMTIEDNHFYNNIIYGIDPHSGTYNLSILQNKVYNNGWHGIICSRDCRNITVESNEVYNNAQTGIILHDNTTNSIISKNVVYDNKQDQISLQNSANNNQIHNNYLSGGISGIEIAESSKNKIYDNTIKNGRYNIFLYNGSSDNIILSNNIVNASTYTLYGRDSDSRNNSLVANQISATDPVTRFLLVNSSLTLINNAIEKSGTTAEFILRNNSALVLQNNTMASTAVI